MTAVKDFVHETPPRRVVFGSEAIARLADEIAALGLRRVLVVTGGVFDNVAQHVPEQLAAAAVAATKEAGADALCSVGGGSATGLAKAVALELSLPIVAVPTTFAGSEMTPIYGITGEHKRTGRDPRVQPLLVVYDPDLLVDLPPSVVAASGLNALAHAVAVLLATDGDPVARLHAREAARTLVDVLEQAVAAPADPQARGAALYAAFLAADAMAGGSTAGVQHRLAHIVGGTYRLTHAQVHAALLPHTIAFELERNARASDGGAGRRQTRAWPAPRTAARRRPRRPSAGATTHDP